ncbi:hypothetical protein MM236_13585 [Belliella sp. DSM 107340]|uniref:Uncharacterized protein n=1 Tax=Belliella calami TaxID=2923436 RepID=A0ABS9UQY8_9BACT|nr:hypothetical protein [Belliella calami]MCH7399031.1 hypothetical protein [Belliella calami]
MGRWVEIHRYEVGRAAGTEKLVYRLEVGFAISSIGVTDILIMDFNQ